MLSLVSLMLTFISYLLKCFSRYIHLLTVAFSSLLLSPLSAIGSAFWQCFIVTTNCSLFGWLTAVETEYCTSNLPSFFCRFFLHLWGAGDHCYPDMMINKQLLLTYLYLLIYILLSSGVILYNKVCCTCLILYFINAFSFLSKYSPSFYGIQGKIIRCFPTS